MKMSQGREMYRMFVIWMVMVLLMCCQEVAAKGTVNSCVKATQALARTGNGREPDSCAGCDPAVPDCPPGCQGYIKSVYFKCDDVCLPDGYYFDPQNELSGCFGPNQFKFKIKVERCGCNSAYSKFTSLSPLFVCISVFLLSLYFSYS